MSSGAGDQPLASGASRSQLSSASLEVVGELQDSLHYVEAPADVVSGRQLPIRAKLRATSASPVGDGIETMYFQDWVPFK